MVKTGRAIAALMAWLLTFWGATALAGVLTVTSPSFKDGEKMPRSTGCEGAEHSPALTVSGIPAGTKSLALLMTETDGPKAGTALWMAVNIAPGGSGSLTLAENQPKARQMKGEGQQIAPPGGKTGYTGPCPPQGVTRRYLIEVFALDATLDLPESASKQEFLLAVEGRILARGKIGGRYKK